MTFRSRIQQQARSLEACRSFHDVFLVHFESSLCTSSRTPCHGKKPEMQKYVGTLEPMELPTDQPSLPITAVRMRKFFGG